MHIDLQKRAHWLRNVTTGTVVAAVMLASAQAQAAILTLFNFNDMQTLANGTTVVTKDNVPGVPTLTMVENNNPLSGLTGVTGAAFTDADGDLHASTRSAGWASTVQNSYWVLDLSTTGYEDLSLRFDNRSSGAGATSVTIAWAVGGGAFTDVTTLTLNRDAAFTAYTVDLSAVGAIEDAASVQLRGLWGTDGTGANTRLDNVQLTGNPVPEPTSAMLVGIGIVGATLARKRQRRAGL